MTHVKSISFNFDGFNINNGRPTFSPGQTLRGCVDVEIVDNNSSSNSRLLPSRLIGQFLHHSSSPPHLLAAAPATGGGGAGSGGDGPSSDAASGNSSNNNDSADAILLRLEGGGKTQWRAAGDYYFRMRDTFTNQRTAIELAQDLPSGRHSFPFEFELPDDLPPSFEGKHGFIRYRLRAKYKHHDVVTMPIYITYVEEVNDTDLLNPVEDTRRRNLHLWCVSWGSRAVHAKVDRTVYHYQGDVALISARFSNECGKMARPVVKLVQQQTFYGRGLISKTVKKSVCEFYLAAAANMDAMAPNEERIWKEAECTLPAVTPSFHSSVIDVDYYIELELVDASSSKVAMKLSQKPIASIWILMASGPFQKKPPPTPVTASSPIAAIDLTTMMTPVKTPLPPSSIKFVAASGSASSFISDMSELATPSTTNNDSVFNGSGDDDAGVDQLTMATGKTTLMTPLRSSKDLPYIREESKEADVVMPSSNRQLIAVDGNNSGEI